MIVKPPAEEKRILKLRSIYARAEEEIIKEITRKRSLDQVVYAEVAALERVQRILLNMQEEAGEYIPDMVEKYFDSDKDRAGYENAGALTSAQTDITQMLINNLEGEIMEASAVAEASAAEFLTLARLEADEYRRAALESVTEAEATGWWDVQKRMAAKLQSEGITSFVDKAGRRWSLTNYCNMATRTTARQAEVSAILTRDDHDLYQIVKIGSTCKICAAYEGRIYSKSGLNPEYPPLSAAFGKIDPDGPDTLNNTYLNIHPNCLHSLTRYTTIGKSEEQIQKDKDFSSFEKRPADIDYRTKKQREAYRKKETNRRKYVEDMKQWKKYKAALGKDVPGFETFRKHKLEGDDKYREWESMFRSIMR